MMEETSTQNKAIVKKYIDVDKIIKDKNPKLLKMLPGFVLRYVKRVLHQDQVNDFINRHGDKYDHDFVKAIITEFGAHVVCKGLENVPERGGFVIASNHPLGGLDGMSLMYSLGTKRKDMRFVVNDILLNIENLKGLFVPVNKHGSHGAEMVKMINEQFASDSLTLVFPAGLVSRRQSGGIVKDLEWKKSFITKSRQYQRDIIPVHIEGGNSSFFYNLSMWRKRLGVKANIEMFYLVDEMYNQANKTIHITFGKPIPWQTFNKSKSDKDWADEVKEIVYNIHYK